MKHNTFKFVGLLVAVLLIGGLLWVPSQVVFAATDSGTGTLDAQGRGLAGLSGNGTVKVSGSGTLWIKDSGGDAVTQVTGAGRATKFPGGWTRYAGLKGDAAVHGSDIQVEITGVNINLHAEGTGKFYLRGKGTFTTGATSGTWPGTRKSFDIQ